MSPKTKNTGKKKRETITRLTSGEPHSRTADGVATGGAPPSQATLRV